MSSLLGNAPLEKVMQANLQHLGSPPFDDGDRKFAQEMQTTFSEDDIASAHKRFGAERKGDALCAEVIAAEAPRAQMRGSTDVGDVSWVVPTVQACGATFAIGTPPHSWQMVAQGKTAAAHKGMVHTAKAMAATAVDVLRDAKLLAEAKADFEARTKSFAYRSPLPKDTKPPLVAN
jgi:aminobenzoyl-glutamate utilization protein B